MNYMQHSIIRNLANSIQTKYPLMSKKEIGSFLIDELEENVIPSAILTMDLPKEFSSLSLLKGRLFMKRLGTKARATREKVYETIESQNKLIRQFEWLQHQFNEVGTDSPISPQNSFDSILDDSIAPHPTKVDGISQTTSILQKRNEENMTTHRERRLREIIKDETVGDMLASVNECDNSNLSIEATIKKEEIKETIEEMSITSSVFDFMKCYDVSDELTHYLENNIDLLEGIVLPFSDVLDVIKQYNPFNQLLQNETGFRMIEIIIYLDIDDTDEYYGMVESIYEKFKVVDIPQEVTFSFKNISASFDPFNYLIENPISNPELTSHKYRDLVD